MKQIFGIAVALCLFGAGLAGCQNTAEGAKQDATNDTAAAKNAADRAAVTSKEDEKRAEVATDKAMSRMASATEKAAKNVGDNLDVRPKVKDAIINDSELNNTANEVHVTVEAGVLTLSGHVLTNEMKQRAGKIARQTLKESNSPDTLKNSLTVQGNNKM